MIGREDEIREYRDRVKTFQAVVVFMLLLVISRLVYLQIMKGDELRRFSEANRLKKEKIAAPRGIFFDRNGKVIVDNRAAFDVVLLSQYYPFDKPNYPSVTERLAKALGMSYEDLEKRLNKTRGPSFYPVLLKTDVSKDVIAAIETATDPFPGVDIEANVQRRYPFGDISAQLLGYTGEASPAEINDSKKILQPGDTIGKMGIEKNLDGYLRGLNGVGYVEVDATGRRKKTEGAEKLLGFVSQVDPTPGNNLYLTLDVDLEEAAAKALRERHFNGTVVALDPRSGEVLALVNLPSYNPGSISGREVNPKVWNDLRTNQDRPLRNRALQDIYPPGSTFKLFVAIAALAEKAATLRTAVNCTGVLQYGNQKRHCWHVHGFTDFLKSIKESCDIFFYKLGDQLGVDKIARYARAFGLGTQTGILGTKDGKPVLGESAGLIPDSEWKQKKLHDIWHPGETLSVAIGQGYVSVTPLQLVTAYAAIGNGGFLYKPYLIRRIESRTGEIIKEYQPELVRKIDVPREVLEDVKEGLFRVVNETGGTAALSGRSKIVIISGKTGTAQVRGFADISKIKCESLPLQFRNHGWFVGYAPRDNPEIAVVGLAEHACHPSVAAAPIVRDVIESYLLKKAVLSGTPLPPIEKTPRAATPSPRELGEDEVPAEPAEKKPVVKPGPMKAPETSPLPEEPEIDVNEEGNPTP